MIENFLRRPHGPVEVMADLLRVLGLLSVVAAAIWWEWTDAGVLAFALPGLLVPRFLGARPAFDIVFTLTLLTAAWSNVFDLYTRISWWDIAIHTMCTGVLAAMLYLACARWGIVAAPGSTAFTTASAILMTTIFGLALSAAWEVVEWLGHTYITDQIFVTYDDTVTDMIAGGTGAALGGLAVASFRLTRDPGQ